MGNIAHIAYHVNRLIPGGSGLCRRFSAGAGTERRPGWKSACPAVFQMTGLNHRRLGIRSFPGYGLLFILFHPAPSFLRYYLPFLPGICKRPPQERAGGRSASKNSFLLWRGSRHSAPFCLCSCAAFTKRLLTACGHPGTGVPTIPSATAIGPVAGRRSKSFLRLAESRPLGGGAWRFKEIQNSRPPTG